MERIHKIVGKKKTSIIYTNTKKRKSSENISKQASINREALVQL